MAKTCLMQTNGCWWLSHPFQNNSANNGTSNHLKIHHFRGHHGNRFPGSMKSVLRKLHIHQTLSEVPSKPGGRLVKLSQQWKGNSSSQLFMGYAGFSRGVVLLTTCMNLAIFLSGFIAQVAPTAAFDHLQRLFPQFSG